MTKKLAITAVIFVLISVIYRYRSPIYAQLNTLKLVPQEEHLTELYFNNHLSLPKLSRAGNKISFSFTIHNLEGKEMEYPYSVYIKSGTIESPTIVDSNKILVKSGESKVISETYTFKSSPATAVVFAELTDLHQNIHFLLSDKE